MKIVDTNVLLYAVNSSSTHHKSSMRWLDNALSGADTVGMAWVPLLAFVRLTTKHGLFPSPLRPEDALRQVTEWCGAPGAVVVNPTPRHVDVLRGILAPLGAGGNLVNDAHLAALAVEHKCEIISFDNDFSRFAGVRWREPDQRAAPGTGGALH